MYTTSQKHATCLFLAARLCNYEHVFDLSIIRCHCSVATLLRCAHIGVVCLYGPSTLLDCIVVIIVIVPWLHAVVAAY